MGGGRGHRVAVACALALALLAGGCASRRVRRIQGTPAPMQAGQAARLHLKDGRVVAFERWERRGDSVVGRGTVYDADRRPLETGTVIVPAEDVVVVVTTHTETYGSGPFVAMTIVTGIGAALCALNPKACFGSCPTFYVPHPGAPEGWALQAEGFSTSIAPALEADDLDDLPLATPGADGAVTVRVRNEAYETHVLRRVELLVVDVPADAPPGAHAVQLAPGGFAAAGPPLAPERCSDPAACALVAAPDGDELTLPSDGVDLAARAELILAFPAPGAPRAAVVLTARHTLMTTFVLYQIYAYFGAHVGELVAAIERHDLPTWVALGRWGLALDGVRVEARQQGEPWRPVGRLPYVGPIAAQTRALAFDVAHPDAPVEVRLSFVRADLRLDAARLAPLHAEDLAAARVPARVTAGAAGAADAARAEDALAGRGDPLVTLPGDDLQLAFTVSPAPRPGRGYFLHARGYYLEWMRKAWMRDEDLARGWRLFRDPGAALRELAPAYRRVEPEMDAVFEASRFRRPAEAR